VFAEPTCPQVLVHGDAYEMMRLKKELIREYEEADRVLDIRTPKNCEDVELHFRGERVAKVRGPLLGARAQRSRTPDGQGAIAVRTCRHSQIIGALAADAQAGQGERPATQADAAEGAELDEPKEAVGEGEARPAVATPPPAPVRTIEGVVVTKDFNTTILAPSDLVEFTGLTTRCV